MASRRGGSWETPSQLRNQLQSMDEFEFEHLIADLWREQGWEADVEQQSGDAGIDVRARKQKPYPKKVLIQAKRYSDDNPVGGRDIQQYSALHRQEPNVDEVIVVTTGHFTNPAEDRARDLNVKTLDGDDLVNLIDHLDAYDIVNEYIGGPRADPNSSTKPQPEQDVRTVNDLDPEAREAIEELVGQDAEEFLRDESYRATRAFERASGWVRINPSDARRIGIFDNLLIDNPRTNVDHSIDDLFSDQVERIFPNESWKLIYLKEDIHLDADENVFVEDLTEYVPHTVIKGDERGPIIGQIERGVSDGHWMSEEGEVILAGKERFKQFVSWANNGLAGLKAQYNEEKREAVTTSTSDSTTTTETEAAGNKPEGYYVVVAGTVGWLSSVFLMGFVDQFPPILLIPLVCWLILPVGLLMDGKQAGLLLDSRTTRSIHPRVEVSFYVLLSLIPWVAFFSGIAYLYRRHRILEE